MSRYTEIETAAHNAYEDYLYENSQDFANGIGIGFRRGAEWADKTMLEKACMWLENNAEDFTIDGGLSIENLIYSFKKAMKE